MNNYYSCLVMYNCIHIDSRFSGRVAEEDEKLNIAEEEEEESLSDHEIFTDSRNIPSPMSDDVQLMVFLHKSYCF